MTFPRPSVAIIKHAVAEHHGLTVADLIGSRGNRNVAAARQLAMLLSRRLAKRSLGEIGRSFNRHHSTVIEAVRQAEARLNADARDLPWLCRTIAVRAMKEDIR